MEERRAITQNRKDFPHFPLPRREASKEGRKRDLLEQIRAAGKKFEVKT
jgi:hypothetical protein